MCGRSCKERISHIIFSLRRVSSLSSLDARKFERRFSGSSWRSAVWREEGLYLDGLKK